MIIFLQVHLCYVLQKRFLIKKTVPRMITVPLQVAFQYAYLSTI